MNFTGHIEGHATVNYWDFDDGTFGLNQAGGLIHSFANMGDYTVKLLAYNDSHPAGVSATILIHVENGLHFVSSVNPNPVPPYSSWVTAATNIQDALDAATVVGALVTVTNGLYSSVSVNKLLTLRSVNGPQSTIIVGVGRCVSLTNRASLSGFTLTNGFAELGGGVWCQSASAVVSNCVIIGCAAVSGHIASGGGTYGGTLNNCTLIGNEAVVGGMGSQTSAFVSGGGASSSTLNNSTLIGNSAYASYFVNPFTLTYEDGGGASGCTLNNCTLISNAVASAVDSSGLAGGGASGCTLNNCTLIGNSSADCSRCSRSDGASGCTLNNCIVYFNGLVNCSGCSMRY